MGPIASWELSRPKLAAAIPTGLQRRRRHHRLRRVRQGRAADDARPQRQRLLRVDLRRAARCRRGAHLDRRRRRHERRSAPGAGGQDHRRDVVQRGHGARVLRRQGHSSADDGAGRRPRHSAVDPQYVQRDASRHQDLGVVGLARGGRQRHQRRRQGRAREPRGRRHDRRARHGRSAVRRAARRRRVGHADLAGQLRAFDLLRRARGSRRAGARQSSSARSPSSSAKGRCSASASRRAARSSPSSATTWPACRAARAGSSARSATPASTCARSRRAPPSATSPPSSTPRT